MVTLFNWLRACLTQPIGTETIQSAPAVPPLKPKFSEAENKEITDRINERANRRPCSVCGHEGEFRLADGFVFLVTQSAAQALDISGMGLPCIILVCRNCGNTQLLNMLILGLERLVEG